MFSFCNTRYTGATLRSFFAAALLAVCLMPLGAQTQAINGSIRGRITDPAGSAIPAATVTVTNTATGFTRDAQTGDDGYFVIPNLPIGT
ncbi:MAG TPA: carboxypeptidase-like regulatory domain-containing protein, partial [Bryobacteraceae bacterium]|nr:carboxypeptidase-like regulatory domain-containing protein [Bryobacteraceae bacterium]